MRKKTFLKAVSIFACFSILMLSVPGVIAAEKSKNKLNFDRLVNMSRDTLATLLPFLNLKINDDKDTTSNQTSNDDSGQKIKATGNLISMKGPRKGDS